MARYKAGGFIMSTIGLSLLLSMTYIAPVSAAPSDATYRINVDDGGKLARYIEENPAKFSGFWYDSTVDRFVIAANERTNPATATIWTELSKVVPARSHDSAAKAVTIEDRRWSLADLRAVFDGVTQASQTPGFLDYQLKGWYIDQKANVVVVEAGRQIDTLASKLTSLYGTKIHIVEGVGENQTTERRTKLAHKPRIVTAGAGDVSTQRVSWPRYLDSLDYYTGNRMVRWVINPDGTYDVFECSNAATNFEETYLYTAGHCSATGDGWSQGYLDVADSTIYVTGFIGYVGSVQWGNNRPDAASIPTTTYTKRQWVGPKDTTASQPAIVWQDNYVGLYVCGNGTSSGLNCLGQVIATNSCRQFPGVLTCEITVARRVSGQGPLSIPGDSGGPVIKYDSTGNANIVGIVSGVNTQTGDLLYTPMSRACGSVAPFTVTCGY